MLEKRSEWWIEKLHPDLRQGSWNVNYQSTIVGGGNGLHRFNFFFLSIIYLYHVYATLRQLIFFEMIFLKIMLASAANKMNEIAAGGYSQRQTCVREFCT